MIGTAKARENLARRRVGITKAPTSDFVAGIDESTQRPLALLVRKVSAKGVIVWPAPGSEDTELGVLMEPEVDHGEAEVYTRVQA